MKVKVSNMLSANGNEVPNQFQITIGNKTYFQSYNSVIAVTEPGKPTKLDRNKWDYSRTTMRYLGRFLGENVATIREKIATKQYKLANLN